MLVFRLVTSSLTSDLDLARTAPPLSVGEAPYKRIVAEPNSAARGNASARVNRAGHLLGRDQLRAGTVEAGAASRDRNPSRATGVFHLCWRYLSAAHRRRHNPDLRGA